MFCAVLCTRVVHNYTHRNVNSYKICCVLGSGFVVSVFIPPACIYYFVHFVNHCPTNSKTFQDLALRFPEFSVTKLIFQDFGFSSLSTKLSDCWEDYLRNDLFSAELRHRRLSGNSLRQTVHTHGAFVHQAAKFVAALLRVAGVTAGLAESNGSLPPDL